MPVGEALGDDLADDEPLRPAERLQRPDLAHALADRREREQHGQKERGDARRRSRARARGCARGSTASTSEPLIESATCFALATCAPEPSVCSISFCTVATTALLVGAHEDDVREALSGSASFWSCASGT